MQQILLLVNHPHQADELLQTFQKRGDAVSVWSTDQQNLARGDYNAKTLSRVNVVISLIGPHDVDLVWETLGDAIMRLHPPLKLIVMLSTAGIDHEVNGNLNYVGVKNVNEYLNQQRYAVKLIDETEIPYVILRPVDIVDRQRTPVQIIDEGKTVPTGIVSRETINQIVTQIVINKKYINHSIALIEEKGDEND